MIGNYDCGLGMEVLIGDWRFGLGIGVWGFGICIKNWGLVLGIGDWHWDCIFCILGLGLEFEIGD